MSDEVDVRPEDALQVAQRALAKANELDEQYGDTVAELEESVTALELRLSEMDDDRQYDERTLDEKVGMVREHGFEKATQHGGRTQLTYDDVMWEVFDGEPSPSHCYKLIRLAAGLSDGADTGSEVPGFRARDPDTGTYHLAVDADRAKDGVAFYSENKAHSEGGR